jgi:hypothetical protein
LSLRISALISATVRMVEIIQNWAV